MIPKLHIGTDMIDPGSKTNYGLFYYVIDTIYYVVHTRYHVVRMRCCHVNEIFCRVDKIPPPPAKKKLRV